MDAPKKYIKEGLINDITRPEKKMQTLSKSSRNCRKYGRMRPGQPWESVCKFNAAYDEHSMVRAFLLHLLNCYCHKGTFYCYNRFIIYLLYGDS